MKMTAKEHRFVERRAAHLAACRDAEDLAIMCRWRKDYARLAELNCLPSPLRRRAKLLHLAAVWARNHRIRKESKQ